MIEAFREGFAQEAAVCDPAPIGGSPRASAVAPEDATPVIRRPTISERRRRVPRQTGVRSAAYRLGNELQPEWHACRVLDLCCSAPDSRSTNPLSRDLVGCEVSVQVQTASALTGAPKNSCLVGVIRDVSTESDEGLDWGFSSSATSRGPNGRSSKLTSGCE